jgi:hypothetical protein
VSVDAACKGDQAGNGQKSSALLGRESR